MARVNGRKALETACLLLLFTALAVAVAYPALRYIGWWGAHDWVQFYTYYGVPHRAVTQFGEMPAWNPYFYGGNVQWGHPDDPTLSPLFLLMLAFGVIPGAKVALVLVLAGGMYSMWILARHLALSPPAAFFASVVWGLNGWHAYHFAVGHCDHFTFLFEPLAVYFLLKAFDDVRWSIGVAAVMALMYFSGGPYPLVFASILVVVMALVFAGRHNSARPLRAAFVAFLFAGAFMAVKLFATLEFMLFAERVPMDISGTGVDTLLRALFDPSIPMPARYGGTQYGAWEYAAYVGYLPVALFLVGALSSARKVWPWLVVAAPFLVASFGSASPVNFFSVFAALPGLSGMHVPFRFIIHVILVVCIVGGFGLDVICSRLSRTSIPKAALICGLAAGAVSLGFLLYMHYARPVSLYRLASYLIPPKKYGGQRPEKLPFRPLTEKESVYVPVTHDQALQVYTHFLESARLPWGYDATRLRKSALFPTDDGYRGEVYVLQADAGSAKIAESTLSRYVVSYTATAPTTLVLNQNYMPGWTASGVEAEVYDRGGLVAVDVPAGQGSVTFAYRPRCLWPGAGVTLASLVAAFFFCRRNPASSPEPPSG
jgi:hypothetical protein